MLSLTDWLLVLLAMGSAGLLCFLIDKLVNRPKPNSYTSEQTIREQALSGTRAQMRPRAEGRVKTVHRQEGDVVYPQSHPLDGLKKGHEQEAVLVTRHASGHQDPFHHEETQQHSFASSYTQDPESKPFLGFHKSEAQLVSHQTTQTSQRIPSQGASSRTTESASKVQPVQASSAPLEKSKWWWSRRSGGEALANHKHAATSASLAKERLRDLGLGQHGRRSGQKTFTVAETLG